MFAPQSIALREAGGDHPYGWLLTEPLTWSGTYHGSDRQLQAPASPEEPFATDLASVPRSDQIVCCAGNVVTSEQTAERLYAAFTAGDTDGVIALLDPAIQWELVGPEAIPYFGRYEGIDAVRRFFDVLASTITVETFEVHRVTPSATGVIAEGFERGAFSLNVAGYEMRWCHVMAVRDGRIVELTDYLDTAPMLEAWNV